MNRSAKREVSRRGLMPRLHADERGTISILSVVTLLMLTILMGMLINVGRQVDDKVRLQNAADAASFSGGVVLARGMNALSFTNHLLAEVFALTAYMREGVRIVDSPDLNTVTLSHQILDAWQELVPVFRGAPFPKFAALSPSIEDKVLRERALIDAFGELTAAKAELTLPVLEYILGQPEVPRPPRPGEESASGSDDPAGGSSAAKSHLIPEFQRAVVQAIPLVAQLTMAEVARRHGPAEGRSRTRPLSATLWRLPQTGLLPVGDSLEGDPVLRTLPAVDPSSEGPDTSLVTPELRDRAWRWRSERANDYLNQWLFDRSYDLGPFQDDRVWEHGGKVMGKMSRMLDLWRIFTCAQLRYLSDVQFANTNLPHMIREPTPVRPAGSDPQQILENSYSFIGVVYWPQKSQFFPGVFRAPTRGDAMAFAQVGLFVPWPQFSRVNGSWSYVYYTRDPEVPIVDGGNEPDRGNAHDWLPVGGSAGEGVPHYSNFYDWRFPLIDRDRDQINDWDLGNQNWCIKMVPATASSLALVLQSSPPDVFGVALPNLGGIVTNEIRAINTH